MRSKTLISKNWFAWNYHDGLNKKILMTRIIIMFAIILVGYFVFQFLWNSANQANSTGNGPTSNLFPLSGSDPSISRITNWAVTLTRAVFAVLLGFLILKIGHKAAVLIFLGLIIISFPYLLTPNMHEALSQSNPDNEYANQQISYAIFLIFRIFLTIGGTGILISSASVISKFFTVARQRNFAVKLSTVPAQIATIVASLLFIDAASKIKIAGQWTIIGGVLIGITFVLFLIYMLIGVNFNLQNKTKGKEAASNFNEVNPNTGFKSILSQKRTWFLLIGGIFMLYTGIEPASGVLNNLWLRTPGNVDLSWNTTTGVYSADATAQTYQFAWQMLYSIGVFTGLATIARWTKTKFSAARYVSLTNFVGIIFFALSYLMGALSLNNPGFIAGTLIFCLIGGTFVFGSQAVSGVIIYRWGWNPSQINLYTSFSWTTLYLGYTILDVITSYVGTAGIVANPATYNDLLTISASSINVNVDGIYLFPGVVNDMITSSKPTTLTDPQWLQAQITWLNSHDNYLLGSDPSNLFNPSNTTDPSKYTTLLINSKLNEQLTNLGINVKFDNPINSVANLSNQYVAQICLISVLPIIQCFFYLIIKNALTEERFSWKALKDRHMQFNRTKIFLNKVLKTNFKTTTYVDESA